MLGAGFVSKAIADMCLGRLAESRSAAHRSPRPDTAVKSVLLPNAYSQGRFEQV